MARKRTTYLGKAAESEAVVPIVQINLNGGGGAVTSVNGMVGDVVLAAEHVGAVSAERSVNGHTLTEDIELNAHDVGAVSESAEDIASDDEANAAIDDVYGEDGGIATDDEADAALDEVYGDDEDEAVEGGVDPKTGRQIASDAEVAGSFDKIFGD